MSNLSELQQRCRQFDLPELNVFTYTEHRVMDVENDLDPDNELYSHMNANCKYYILMTSNYKST